MLTLFALLSLSSPALADEPPAPVTIDQVLERMTIELKDVCDFDEDSVKDRKGNSQTFDFEVKREGDDTAQKYRLFEVPCTRGAYNFGSVYYLSHPWYGLQRLSFAAPALNSKDVVIGWETSDYLINSGFDPKELTIGFFNKHRGIGDCSDSGVYKFVEHRFVLKQYYWDGKCDGKINPKRIVNLK